MEYAQLQAFVFVLMSICGGVVGVAACIAVVVRFWKWAHKDTDKNTEDIEALKANYESDLNALKAEYEQAAKEQLSWFASDKRRIESLEADFDEISDQNYLLMRADVAIMDHLLDGNNVEKMQAARDEVDDYLLKNVRKKKRRRETE